MSKMNLLVYLNAYSDANDTINPSLSNFKWSRDVQQISISNPDSRSIKLASGQSTSILSGIETLSSDATTTWDIALKAGTANTYVISQASGTAPNFRTNRVLASDATSQITVTQNAKLLTFTSSGGILLDLSAVQVGDYARIGSLFNVNNQGKFKVLAKTSSSFTVENEIGVAEGPITLGASYADQLSIFSADGVQVNDNLEIVAGFSSVSFGSYLITDVGPDYLEIYSDSSLPSETGVSNSPTAFNVYSDFKTFLYVESDQKLGIELNGNGAINAIEPFVVGTTTKPGVFMSSSSIKSVTLTNQSLSNANIFFAMAK